jgi:tripartite-type tricarboxylate transporter receptor subunit TctC
MERMRIGVWVMAAVMAMGVGIASDWPDEEKIITVVVPHAAGGGTDAAIRPLVNLMQARIPARMQVVNIGGAGSAKGTNEFINLPNDGYAIFVSGTHTIGATHQGLTRGYKELEHVAGLNWDPFIIAVLKTRPYNTMQGFIDEAKKKPGAVSLGNAGMGGATGVASVALDLAFDNVFNITPFNGGQNLRADVLGGRCDAGIFSQSEILSNREAFQPLVILTDSHSDLDFFKTVPTMKECGFENLSVPGGSFRALAVKKGTPQHIKEAMAKIIREAYESKEYQDFMKAQGIISTFTALDEAEAYMDDLISNYEPIVKASGLYKETN